MHPNIQTMLVEKTAAEANLRLLVLSTSAILSKWWAAARHRCWLRSALCARSTQQRAGSPLAAAALLTCRAHDAACRSGDSEKNLRLVFEMAAALQPSLLFIVSPCPSSRGAQQSSMRASCCTCSV